MDSILPIAELIVAPITYQSCFMAADYHDQNVAITLQVIL